MARVFGHIPGIAPGAWFPDLRALADAGVHRPLQAGISGTQRDGADSIVLAGAYEDDIDRGSVIYYTGQGGRHSASGEQYTDQRLTRGNQALARSGALGLPTRVSRKVGEGYRYDGLYQVERYWQQPGRSGHLIWRFKLIPFEEPAPVDQPGVAEQLVLYAQPDRVATTVQRIVRDTAEAQEVKRLYGFRCQVCGETLDTPAGPYAEAAHIQPLGRPHDGPDVLSNLLCLCPNHHVQFDLGQFTIAEDHRLIGRAGSLIVRAKHRLDPAFLAFHRCHIYADGEGG